MTSDRPERVYDSIDGTRFEIVNSDYLTDDGKPCPYCDRQFEYVPAYVVVRDGSRLVCGGCIDPEHPLHHEMHRLNAACDRTVRRKSLPRSRARRV